MPIVHNKENIKLKSTFKHLCTKMLLLPHKNIIPDFNLLDYKFHPTPFHRLNNFGQICIFFDKLISFHSKYLYPPLITNFSKSFGRGILLCFISYASLPSLLLLLSSIIPLPHPISLNSFSSQLPNSQFQFLHEPRITPFVILFTPYTTTNSKLLSKVQKQQCKLQGSHILTPKIFISII